MHAMNPLDELPPPPVPADCDLRSFPYLPLDVVRLRDSRLAATATGDEFRAAVLLWCASWHQIPAASLPTDDRELAALAGYGRDLKGWMKVRAMALHGWVLHADGRIYHPVVAEKAAEAWRQRQMQKAKAEKRWGNAASPGAGTAAADATASPAADAKAMQQIQNRTEQNRNLTSPPPLAASPAREEIPATTTATFTKIHGIDIDAVQRAISSGLFLPLVKALGGNTGKDREPEWKREADGLTLHHVAAIFGWRNTIKSPIREPSGFRQARQAWDAMTAKKRNEIGYAELDSMGVVVRKPEDSQGAA
jgi:hypothetical protein